MKPSMPNLFLQCTRLSRAAAAAARAGVLAAGVLGALVPVQAGEVEIRKAIAERLPNFPKPDEISKTAIPGIWEIRVGADVLYTDENGDHVFEGAIIETKSRTNLTQERIDKLTAIDFKALPLKDAMVVKQGKGTRRLAVFADPNCGYCKRFERDLLAVKDVTIYTFLLPILGEDSALKSRDIWCSKAAMQAWREWMVEDKTPARAMGTCDVAALERNVAFARKYRVNSTPALLFEDGRRAPGALSTDEVEKRLAQASETVLAKGKAGKDTSKGKDKTTPDAKSGTKSDAKPDTKPTEPAKKS
jgi:thiol:disulfide interchange protein DsbC